MGTYDEQIARKLRRLRRELLGVDEAEFAFRMRLRGWPWAEHVVAAIEEGSRAILRAEAIDVMSAFGYSTEFITMRTDAESMAEIVDRRLVRATATVYEMAEDWFETASRFDVNGLEMPTTIEEMLAEGRRAFADPSAVLGAPVPQPEDVAASMTLAAWTDLPNPPAHPLDTIGVGVFWSNEQLLMQYGYELREISHALRIAVVAWLQAAADRAAHLPDDIPRSPERIVDDMRSLRRTG